jgi:putative peptide zinc metalloprotease protein
VWQVIEDASGSQFFRVNEPAWRFIGLLNGRTTVAQAWTAVSEALGDSAPTQGEVIQLLGQLYSANLLQADVAGDTEALFRRQRKRVGREVRAYLLSLLFLRIPLWDPDSFLTRWTPLVAWAFSWFGLALWLTLLGVGGWHLIGRERELASGLSGVLAVDNLLWLYLTFAFIKGLHELGHGFACKALGQRSSDPSGATGAVHTIGVMFLVFMPVPYVDASSSWLFKQKWHRIIVSSAGIVVELALAAIAAIVWSRSAPGTPASAIAFNAMFLAGVSTLVFNGNPLMRYDGYYMLADLLELPNMAKRGQDYVYYLVKRYVWGVRRALSPAYSIGERLWLACYYVASGVYRVFVYIAITLFILNQQWVLGAILLTFIGLAWMLVPTGKLIRFLAADPELARGRSRAIWTTAAACLLLLIAVGLIPLPDHIRIEGVVEPARFANIYAGTEGRIEHARDSGEAVAPGQPPLISAASEDMQSRRLIIMAERVRLAAARRMAMSEDPAEVQRLQDQIAAVEDQSVWVDENLAALTIAPPIDGTWIAPDLASRIGGSMRRGESLGVVADLSTLVVRATADQRSAASLISEARPAVELKARRRPDQIASGTVDRIFPAGAERLPSPALGFAGGGTVATDPKERRGDKAVEPFFEVRIKLEQTAGLLPGQRVIARFRLADRPLLMQAWREISQVLQERFRV